MFFKIAVRNIRAYKKRSIITVILLACTTALLVFATAYMDGSHDRMIRSSVEIYPGYVQITHSDFRDSPSLENLSGRHTLPKDTKRRHYIHQPLGPPSRRHRRVPRVLARRQPGRLCGQALS
ncbi:MAG: hypothetical protein HY789_08945 [Deltaproteobacteria bacterium]|nr:hypothetical protein [Deltaproteobacteria bacterium]